MVSSKLKIYRYYILTFLIGGTMVSNIGYLNSTSNFEISGQALIAFEDEFDMDKVRELLRD